MKRRHALKEKVPFNFYYEKFLIIITYFEPEHKSDVKTLH